VLIDRGRVSFKADALTFEGRWPELDGLIKKALGR